MNEDYQEARRRLKAYREHKKVLTGMIREQKKLVRSMEKWSSTQILFTISMGAWVLTVAGLIISFFLWPGV